MEDELWSELERIEDARALKEKFYAEHQLMREQLNMAGRFGLELQQSLEVSQRSEQQSYAQVIIENAAIFLIITVDRGRNLTYYYSFSRVVDIASGPTGREHDATVQSTP